LRRLSWSGPARRDLIAIAEHYADIVPGLDDEMLGRILDGPRPLLDHPNLGQPLGAFDLRKWTVRRTPFILVYRATDTVVEIARVRHVAEDWRKS
jgi:plasmid stabilization system protein ParE